MVCKLLLVATRENESEKLSRWNSQSTLTSVTDESAAYTLGITRRTKSSDDTWYSNKVWTLCVTSLRMKQNRSTLLNFWTIWMHTDDWLQFFYTTCQQVWRTVWASMNVNDQETRKPHDCDRRWQPRCWPVWRKSGWRKRSSLGPQERRDTSNMQFMWADHFLIMSHSKDVTRPCWRSKQMGHGTCGWQIHMIQRRGKTWIWAPHRDAANFPSKTSSRYWCVQWIVTGKRTMQWKDECSLQTRPSGSTSW